MKLDTLKALADDRNKKQEELYSLLSSLNLSPEALRCKSRAVKVKVNGKLPVKGKCKRTKAKTIKTAKAR